MYICIYINTAYIIIDIFLYNSLQRRYFSLAYSFVLEKLKAIEKFVLYCLVVLPDSHLPLYFMFSYLGNRFVNVSVRYSSISSLKRSITVHDCLHGFKVGVT